MTDSPPTTEAWKRAEVRSATVACEAPSAGLLPESGRTQNRTHHRVGVELDVDLGSDGNRYQGFSENLSRGGIFVATHLVKAVGATVDFCVHMPDGFEPVRGVGEVRWVRAHNERSDVPPGMGILFVRLEPGSTETVARFLSQRQTCHFDE